MSRRLGIGDYVGSNSATGSANGTTVRIHTKELRHRSEPGPAQYGLTLRSKAKR
jgi:hypothetical protein